MCYIDRLRILSAQCVPLTYLSLPRRQVREGDKLAINAEGEPTVDGYMLPHILPSVKQYRETWTRFPPDMLPGTCQTQVAMRATDSCSRTA